MNNATGGRRRVVVCSAVIVCVLALAGEVLGQNRNRVAQTLGALSDSLTELSESISPSVVQIIGTGYGLDNDEQHTGLSILSRQRSTGSGIIVSEDGYVMTNAHVIDSARAIRVKMTGKTAGSTSLFEAKLIGMDSLLDLALLKVDATGLKPLPLGTMREIKQGQLVLAFGSPLGMDNSVSMGIISAVSRQLSEDDPRIFIQTDTPINPGSSGGPLVDIQGRLVGINTFIFTQSGGSEGLGFAIPSNVVRYALASLKRDGHVHRGQIGIFARTITPPLALAFSLEPETGVLVEDVNPGGPAEKAGVQMGDVLLSIAGAPLHNVRDLSLQLYEFNIGNTVELQILRGSKEVRISVPVTEKEDDAIRFADLVNPTRDMVAKLAILGVAVEEKISQLLNLRLHEGVLVAAFAGPPPYFGDQLREADVIHAVNGRRINSLEALRAELDNVKQGQPIVLQVERAGVFSLLVLEEV